MYIYILFSLIQHTTLREIEKEWEKSIRLLSKNAQSFAKANWEKAIKRCTYSVFPLFMIASCLWTFSLNFGRFKRRNENLFLLTLIVGARDTEKKEHVTISTISKNCTTRKRISQCLRVAPFLLLLQPSLSVCTCRAQTMRIVCN